MHFKELAFFRIRADQPDKLKPPIIQVKEVRDILQSMSWSVQNEKHHISHRFMTIDNLSIFKKGIIIR